MMLLPIHADWSLVELFRVAMVLGVGGRCGGADLYRPLAAGLPMFSDAQLLISASRTRYPPRLHETTIPQELPSAPGGTNDPRHR